ncbi:response regulator transcription factor [Pelagerythrobacter marensis]|uniref:Response regulator transcription factor n=1 Tax=Pelagerythrobacter marensis TaxID=543877 RepID=A0ABZ2D4I0_9SPHN
MRDLGHACEIYSNGQKFISALRRDTFDVILLDWHLPDILGFDLLQQLRSGHNASAGIIMLTNRSDKDAIAQALRAGADDYIVKPESASVIGARVEAVNRRSQQQQQQQSRRLVFDRYEFDRLTQSIWMDKECVKVSGKEFALALMLFENINRPLSRGYILETIWQANPDLPTRTLDVHISRIRIKLRLVPENGLRIAAISGFGYRLERFLRGEEG